MLNAEKPSALEEDAVFEEAYSGSKSIGNLERSYIQLHAYAFSITYKPLITVDGGKENKSLLKLLDFYSFIQKHGTGYFTGMNTLYTYPGPVLEHEAVLEIFNMTGSPLNLKKCYLYLLSILNTHYRNYLNGVITYDQMSDELKPYIDRWIAKG